MTYCTKMMSAVRPILVATTLLLMSQLDRGVLAAVQHGPRDEGSMEEFEEIDPYTKGERELLDKLGYVRFGPFTWTKGHPTNELEEMLGGTPMIWVETEHFKIGSSLSTYKVPADKEEKERLKEEIKRLKKRLGRLKTSRNELDPWLRLHLFAQRAEELYAKFVTDFGLTPDDFGKKEPYLGNPNKFLVLLCQRKSELSRYTKGVHNQVQDAVFRMGLYKDCMVLGASMESIVENFPDQDNKPFDSIMHCRMIASLTTNFVDGFQSHLYQAPRWLGNVLAHYYVRQVDPRWMISRGHGPNDAAKEDGWKWEPVIMQLVKNKFFASAEQMFAWEKYEDMNKRDHMIAWSKIEYLMTVAEGDRSGWIEAMCRRGKGGKGGDVKKELVERQTRALLGCFELTPKELDAAWVKWVKKVYKRR